MQKDGFRFAPATLELARTESNKCWKTPATHFERDNLLLQCDRGIISPVREECRKALDDAFCTTLKATIVGKVDRGKIKAELKRQVEKLQVNRIRHSFNKMSQGKTKVCSSCWITAIATATPVSKLLAMAVHLLCPFECPRSLLHLHSQRSLGPYKF